MTVARGYSIAFARDMIPDRMKAYSDSLPPIYEKYQGKYLAIGGPGRGVDWLAGTWADRMLMIGEFPNFEAVSEFWWSPEYREAARRRQGAVKVDVGQVPGTDRVPSPSDTVFLLIVVPASNPVEVKGGTCLISAPPAALVTLEGNLRGLATTLVGFPTREDLSSAWSNEKKVADLKGYACAAIRAPE